MFWSPDGNDAPERVPDANPDAKKRRTAKGGLKRFVRRPVFFRPVVKMNHPDEIKLMADACVNCVTLTGHDSNERGG